jgi:hypothetical protein
VPKKEHANCGNPTHQSKHDGEARAITVAFPTRCGFLLELWTTLTQSFIKFPRRFESSEKTKRRLHTRCVGPSSFKSKLWNLQVRCLS